MLANQPSAGALVEARLLHCCCFLTVDAGTLRMFLDCLFIHEFSAALL